MSVSVIGKKSERSGSAVHKICDHGPQEAQHWRPSVSVVIKKVRTHFFMRPFFIRKKDQWRLMCDRH